MARAISFAVPVAVAILGLFAALGRAQERARPLKIPVTSTAAELGSSESVEIASGVVVRLGVSARQCGRQGGVLLYCLTSGYLPTGREEFNRCGLGPLRFSVSRVGQPVTPPRPDGVTLRADSQIGVDALYIPHVCERGSVPGGGGLPGLPLGREWYRYANRPNESMC